MRIQSSKNLSAVSTSGKTSIVSFALKQAIKQAEASFGVFYSTADPSHCSNGHGYPFSMAEGCGGCANTLILKV